MTTPTVYADPGNMQGPYKEARDKMKAMSKEDKKAVMEDAKAKWSAMSDADKQAFKDKVKDVAEKRKARLEKKCEELRQGNGEMIYINLYALDLVKQGKAAK